MAHIHTEPGQHDFTTSAYIVRDDMDEPRVLLHMHRKLHRLLQPGGHVELHEHLWSSIAHELQEETGYSMDDLEVMQPELRISTDKHVVMHPQPVFVNTHEFPDIAHYHIDSSYLFRAHKEPTKMPAEGESTDLRWLSANDLKELPPEIIGEDTREICLDILARFFGKWVPLPANSFATKS